MLCCFFFIASYFTCINMCTYHVWPKGEIAYSVDFSHGDYYSNFFSCVHVNVRQYVSFERFLL